MTDLLPTLISPSPLLRTPLFVAPTPLPPEDFTYRIKQGFPNWGYMYPQITLNLVQEYLPNILLSNLSLEKSVKVA